MLIVFRCLSVLPLRLLHTLGSALGWVAYFGSSTYRARFQQNVAQAGLEPRAARAAIGAAGQLVAELPWIWLRRMCRNNRSFSGKAQNWLTRRWHAARA